MKILMLTDFYLPTIGGVERHVASLSRTLVKLGHEVAVCTVRQKGMEPFDIDADVQIHRLEALFQRFPFIYSNPAKKFHPPIKDPKIEEQLEKFVKDFKPDVVHSHGWIVFSYLSLKSRLRIPLVHTLHHYGFICPRQDLFYKNEEVCTKPFSFNCYSCCAKQQGLAKSILTCMYVRRNRRKLTEIDKFLAVSSFVREAHIRYLSIPSEKISVIPNFCDVASEEGSAYEDSLPDDFILYVGALMPHKGIDVLLEAHRLSNTDLPLVLIGSKHPDYDYGKYHDGKRVFVIEDAPRGLVIEAYRKCEFVMIPSIWADPCPTVALEAMAYGKPVVASDVGGLPDIVVDHETGLIVSPGNMKALSEAIRKMADMQKMRSKMGVRAKERFSELFAAEKAVSRVEEVYYALH